MITFSVVFSVLCLVLWLVLRILSASFFCQVSAKLPARVAPAPSVSESGNGQDEDQEDDQDDDQEDDQEDDLDDERDDHAGRSGSPPLEGDAPDPPSATSTKRKVVLALHSRLAELFPNSFHYKETNLPYWESSSEKPFPLLCVNPELEGTWLRPPPCVEDDYYGYWKSDTNLKLPPSKSSLAPPRSLKPQLRRPAYFHLPDVELQALLEAPTRDKIFLPPNIFDRTSVSVKSSPLALLDAHLRTSLLESFTTESYMRILVELANCAAGTAEAPVVGPSEAVSLLPEVSRQAAEANARSQQSLTAAFVTDTVALRDYVLNNFVVNERTLGYLRGGDFSTRSLFGPLPEHFSTLLDSPHNGELRCSSKSASFTYATPTTAASSYASTSYNASVHRPSTSSTAQKRSASSRGNPKAKRTSAPVSRPPKGRGKRFQRGSAGRRSGPGRS